MCHRTSIKHRAVLAALAGIFVIAAAGRAEAQLFGTGGTTGLTGTGGTTGSTTFSLSDFFPTVQFPNVNVSLTAFQLQRFFNKANCDCSTPINLFISLLPTGIAKRNTAGITAGMVSVVLGNGCTTYDSTAQALGGCLLIASEPVLTFLNMASYTIQTDARTLSTYFNNTGVIVDAGTASTGTQATGTAPACSSPIGQTFTQTVNFNFDFGDGMVDLSVPLTLSIDLVPPPTPTGFTIRGGDQALVLNWTAVDTATTPDLLGYQVLCSRANQYQVFKGTDNDAGEDNGAPFTPAFQTCPTTREAAEAAGATSIEALDPAFSCSGQLAAQATSDRVEILQNGITYAAAVVAVDNAGNASPPMVEYGTPIRTLSFYDVYRDETPQGGATGGFCALTTARTGAKATGAAVALFAVGSIVVVVSRRRKGRR